VSGDSRAEMGDHAPFRVEALREPDGVRIIMRGELDMVGCEALAARVAESTVPGEQLTLDALGLAFIDSTGSQALADAAAGARARGARRVVLRVDPDGPIARVLRLTGIGDLFEPGADA
jgi:anti-sigma B factor antagonist